MGMATIGPEKIYVYIGRIDIPPENPKPHMTKGGYRVSQAWDFNTSEIKTWLAENCSGKWNYKYGHENDDESMQVNIFFEDAIDAMAFRLEWE